MWNYKLTCQWFLFFKYMHCPNPNPTLCTSSHRVKIISVILSLLKCVVTVVICLGVYTFSSTIVTKWPYNNTICSGVTFYALLLVHNYTLTLVSLRWQDSKNEVFIWYNVENNIDTRWMEKRKKGGTDVQQQIYLLLQHHGQRSVCTAHKLLFQRLSNCNKPQVKGQWVWQNRLI